MFTESPNFQRGRAYTRMRDERAVISAFDVMLENAGLSRIVDLVWCCGTRYCAAVCCVGGE